MADSLELANIITPGGQARSVTAGDIPDHLMRRYYLDGRGGAGLGFYTDARIRTPAFRDQGRSLISVRTDPRAIRDMTAVARHRGWSVIVVRGARDFRRETWLAGQSAGLEVRGYKPTERDLQDLTRKQTVRGGNDQSESPKSRLTKAKLEREPRAPARDTLDVVEAIVRARVAKPASQEKILSGAHQRINNWLARGARLHPLDLSHTQPREPAKTQDRTRRR